MTLVESKSQIEASRGSSFITEFDRISRMRTDIEFWIENPNQAPSHLDLLRKALNHHINTTRRNLISSGWKTDEADDILGIEPTSENQRQKRSIQRAQRKGGVLFEADRIAPPRIITLKG